jgi:transcriptional regulator of arginine metabolism
MNNNSDKGLLQLFFNPFFGMIPALYIKAGYMTKPTNKPGNITIDFALRQLLLAGQATTHESICQALEQQGFTVNQPKISRLLHKLGAIKVTNENGENVYRLPHEHGLMHELSTPQARHIPSEWVLSVQHNQQFIVIHTIPGAAAIIARDIDMQKGSLGILGTLAGDDTIFIAPKDIRGIEGVAAEIKRKIAGK